jgi:hypothetical protein
MIMERRAEKYVNIERPAISSRFILVETIAYVVHFFHHPTKKHLIENPLYFLPQNL